MIKYHLIKRCPLYLKAILRVCLKKTVMNESDLIYKLMNVKGRKSKTMIDVGAHYGDSLSSFLLSGWQIHAFEPDLNNREYLLKQFGKYPNIIIDPRAVSNKEESNVMFYNSDVSTGISTLHPFHPSHKEMSNSVNVITLRSYINKAKIDNIDFLKIDVEGFDLFVLQGFPWVEINPTIILAEFENRKTIPLGYTFHDIAKYLIDKGYYVLVSEWYPVVEYGSVHKFRRFIKYPCKLLDREATGNLIAVSDLNIFNRLISISNKYNKLLKILNKFNK